MFEEIPGIKLLSFDYQRLNVDWISFNIQGLTNPETIASKLSNYFTPHILVDDVPTIGFHGLKKKYKVSIRQYTGSKGFWVGTQIIFSGENAAYFYKLVKTQRFDWNILKSNQHSLNLGRIDLFFSHSNDLNHTNELFDEFLVNSRSKIQSYTTTRHIRLQDYPNGKILKVNRRNNSIHYRVYQKEESIRFEIELKHRETKLVQEYLFQNQFDIFEHQLLIRFFQYSERILYPGYPYTDWVVNFKRQYRQLENINSRSLVVHFIENQIITNQKEKERFFHLLQFLSFVKSLKLDKLKDCTKHQIKEQLYYDFKFPLSKFVKFTGMKVSNKSEREKLIFYFYQLQTLDPIVKIFSNRAFRSYVCFPYVDCKNISGKSWVVEVLAAEELFSFPYPYQLPKSFLHSRSKNDLRLKVHLIKSLAIIDTTKKIDLEKFFNTINVRNSPLIQIKKNLIRLLSELVENKIIQNKVEILLKSGKKKDYLIENLTASDITRRIKYIQLHEIS
jgi:hypothetical protein